MESIKPIRAIIACTKGKEKDVGVNESGFWFMVLDYSNGKRNIKMPVEVKEKVLV